MSRRWPQTTTRWLRSTGIAGTFVLPAAIVILLLAQFSGESIATDTADPVAPEQPVISNDSPPTRAWRARNFFQPFAPGVRHQTYNDMHPDEQMLMDDAKAHYDSHGDSVAQAYRKGTLARVHAAQVIRAERLSGLQGTADVGVD